MLQLRLVWWLVGLAGCAAVAAMAGGLSLSYFREPDARTASREAILRYLAVSDLRGAPPAKLDAFVDRLAAELRQDAQFATGEVPSDGYRRTLAQNAEVLKRHWFVSRVERYHRLAAIDRNSFLDEQIATLLCWANVDKALSDGHAVDEGAKEAAFFDDIERWIADESDTVRRDRMLQAVRDGIARWLATHDLSEQSSAVRRELALVIAAGLNDELDIATLTSEQPSREQSQLRANGMLLAEAWLLVQAERYAALLPDERSKFLDERIEEVSRWRLQEVLQESDATDTALPSNPWAKLSRWIDGWIARAEPSQQAQLRALASDVQARLVVRMIQSLRNH